MKLSNKCINRIQGNRNIVLRLALDLDFTEIWIIKLLEANKDNGPLTTAKALQVIREELNLSDAEVLEESEVKESAK